LLLNLNSEKSFFPLINCLFLAAGQQPQVHGGSGSVGERVALELGASPAIRDRLWGQALGLLRSSFPFHFVFFYSHCSLMVLIHLQGDFSKKRRRF
jgi:hypothetical protein